MKNETQSTSLKKSHSIVSNFKLTLVCLIASLSFSAFWISIAIKLSVSSSNAIDITAISSGVISLICFLILNGFKR